MKYPPANVGDSGSIPGQGRFPGEGNGNPLQYSYLENQRSLVGTVLGVSKSCTWLKWLNNKAFIIRKGLKLKTDEMGWVTGLSRQPVTEGILSMNWQCGEPKPIYILEVTVDKAGFLRGDPALKWSQKVPLQTGQPGEDVEFHAICAKLTTLEGNSFQLDHLRDVDMLERKRMGRVKHLKR